MEINDKKYGKKPYIVNIEEATVQNEMFFPPYISPII